LIAILLVLAVLQADAGRPEEATRPAASTPGTVVKGADLQLLSAVRAVATRVEQLRGEAFARQPIAVRAPEPIRDVAAEIRAYNILTFERIEARGRAWADVGLGDERSPGVLFKTLATDLAGIGHEPGANRLLVSPDRMQLGDFAPEAAPDDEASTLLMMTGVEPDEPLLGHLLMHVRQHERRGADSLSQTTDQTLARSAWAEGESNLLAVRYLFTGLGLADDVMDLDLDPGDLLSGSLVPVDLDGHTAMNRGDTTRDLLHPESGPLRPGGLPPLDAPPVEGMKLADEDSLGEQAILTLLSIWTGKDNLALQAADGWSGDRLCRWESAEDGPGAGVTQWFSRWNGEKDAADFDYALGRALEARFRDRALETVAPGVRKLDTGERVYRVERDGADVQMWILPPGLDARLARPSGGGP
jgi:hypothetical protein